MSSVGRCALSCLQLVIGLSHGLIEPPSPPFCHNPSHSCSHPEVFLRRLAATKDDDGNALQYNTLSHISRKRAVLIFDSFVESLLEDSQVGGATTPQEQTKAAEKPADLNVATLKKLKQLSSTNLKDGANGEKGAAAPGSLI